MQRRIERRTGADQRVHPRVPTAIAARLYVPAYGLTTECLVTDLSAGGAGLEYVSEAPPQEIIAILHVHSFGQFEGITLRESGIRFLFGEAERQNLMAKLTAFVKDGLSDAGMERLPDRRSTSQLAFTRPSGEHEECDVLNISLRDVCLKTEARPPLGELVNLGRMYGRVTLHLEEGIGVQFVSFVAGGQAAL